MTDERAFLAAVAAGPADQTARLVYADWLDDHADPRAELVRIEEEQRTLPATADRYWALKPRRNELRAGCDAEWLRAMGYGMPNPAAFAEWPADVRGRWRFVREYVEQAGGEPLADAGGDSDEVGAVEARLGRVLPAGVREWIAFAADLQTLIGDGRLAPAFLPDRFGPDVVEYREQMPVLDLLVSADGRHLWAVADIDLVRDDPPVTHFTGWAPRVWYPDRHGKFGSVAEFALRYELMHARDGLTNPGPDPAAVVRQARAWIDPGFDPVTVVRRALQSRSV